MNFCLHGSARTVNEAVERAKRAAIGCATIVGRQRQPITARGQYARQRLGGKDVAAGAAGGEHDEGGGAHTTSAAP